MVEVGDAVSRVFCRLHWALVLVMFLGYQFIPAASGPLVVLTLALVSMIGLLLILANVMMWNYGQVANAIAAGGDQSNGNHLSAQSEGAEKREAGQKGRGGQHEDPPCQSRTGQSGPSSQPSDRVV